MPDLSPQVIYLSYAFLEQVQLLPGHALQILSQSERSQYDQFYFENDKQRYLLARYLLRTHLTQYFPAVAPQDWKFKFNSYGKPSLADQHSHVDVHFNLAHSGELVVAAFASQYELGVDVENTSRSTRVLDIAQKIFTAIEYQHLKGLESAELQKLQFFRLWILKEAYAKARGFGLQIPFNQFSFQIREDEKFKINFEAELADDAEKWKIKIFHPAPDYQVAIAVPSANEVSYQENFWIP